MVCASTRVWSKSSAYTLAATTATKVAAAAERPAKVKTRTPTATSWMAMRADSPYVENGNWLRTPYDNVMRRLAVSRA